MHEEEFDCYHNVVAFINKLTDKQQNINHTNKQGHFYAAPTNALNCSEVQ